VGFKRLPDGQYARYDGALARRPNLAALIGEIVAEWSIAETIMTGVFTAVTRMEDGRTAADILDHIQNKETKSRLIQKIAQRKMKDKALKERLAAALGNLVQAGARRDSLAGHGRWATCDAMPSELLWHQSSWPVDGFERYDHTKLLSVVAEIVQARDAVQLLTLEIIEHLTLVENKQWPQRGADGKPIERP